MTHYKVYDVNFNVHHEKKKFYSYVHKIVRSSLYYETSDFQSKLLQYKKGPHTKFFFKW